MFSVLLRESLKCRCEKRNYTFLKQTGLLNSENVYLQAKLGFFQGSRLAVRVEGMSTEMLCNYGIKQRVCISERPRGVNLMNEKLS